MSTDPTALQLQSLRLEKLGKAPTSHPAERTEPSVCSSQLCCAAVGKVLSAQGSPAGLVALQSWIQDEGPTAPLCGPAQLSVGPPRQSCGPTPSLWGAAVENSTNKAKRSKQQGSHINQLTSKMPPQ